MLRPQAGFQQPKESTAVVVDDAEHEAGKAATGAEIEPAPRLRSMRKQLQGIGDMPGPDFVECRARDQILRLLPAPKLVDQNGEALLCFT